MRKILVFVQQSKLVTAVENLCLLDALEFIYIETRQNLQEILQNKKIELMICDECNINAIECIRKFNLIPIMVLADSKNEEMIIKVLQEGADDYITSDCNPLVFLAKIHSQLRRYHELCTLAAIANRIYKVDNLLLDDNSRRVCVNKQEIKLTPIEYKILKLLIQEKGKVISIAEIYESIWKMRAIGADNTVAVHIRHLREKIEINPNDPKYIKVVWGIGYKVG